MAAVLIETSLGDIIVDLFVDERPKCCYNFLKLCQMKFYNFLLFHKVQSNFIAQTGDPTGSGIGGYSIYKYLYGDECSLYDVEKKPKIKHVNLGTVSMVNNGSDKHGSQFFITLTSELSYLDSIHTVFGVVTEGFDTLTKLNEAICDSNHCPYKDIRISHTIVLYDPFENPPNLIFPNTSPEPTKLLLKTNRIAAHEDINNYDDIDLDEMKLFQEERDLKSNKTILEIVGDIPNAELKPPENVLFVCKLNKLTLEEDLAIIFSRFGKVTSCEIVRDRRTGASLQYSFIEYEDVSSCERAYLKMNNVLIDDRRIHVDFCQSVSSLKWKNSKMADRLNNKSIRKSSIKQPNKESYKNDLMPLMSNDQVKKFRKKS